ncbi:4-phosphoerythronate dehydrogenase PdxB [Saccharicrinis aurantiacus]|uniref:4-phosphoerythronate dehydrogenase PdxB n=1 Tax=Saccharicrinis aurantiacus TaxID=1849719 RepID=UPI0024911A3E|nr:4-phosphoerythronate dehydrogenase PdxB [Saccharicrinis aurantiacus]
MLKIIADNKIPFLEGVLESKADIVYKAGAETTPELVKNADALITRTRTKCNAHLLKGSNVKTIATATIGYDHIDTEFCANHNISWNNSPGCNAGSVKQYIAAALATLSLATGQSLKGKTIGIVGVGNVGSKVRDLAKGIGMKVLLNDPPRAEKEGADAFVSLKEIQEKADVITFHVPLQREGLYKTHHLADNVFLAACKKDVVIMNSSRGEVINNADLLNQINTGHISNAVIDVWEEEPAINLNLLSKVLIGTSHIAGYSVDGKANGTAQSVNNISKYFNLGLDNWYPEALPQPKQPIIELDAAGHSFDALWIKAVLHTYPINIDDELLKTKPEDFEQHRGNYMMRREFQAYTIRLKNGNADIIDCLKSIGFINVIEE